MLHARVMVLAAALPDESTTSPVKLSVPPAVGVPVIVPVIEFNISGTMLPEAIEYVYGLTPPMATSAEPYAVPTVPEPTGQESERSVGPGHAIGSTVGLFWRLI